MAKKRQPDQRKYPQSFVDLVRVVGIDAALRLCEEYGGDKIYIPKVDAWNVEQRRELIRKEYNGYNVKGLAKKYHLTVRTVQNILKGQRPKEIEGQMTLDDFL